MRRDAKRVSAVHAGRQRPRALQLKKSLAETRRTVRQKTTDGLPKSDGRQRPRAAQTKRRGSPHAGRSVNGRRTVRRTTDDKDRARHKQKQRSSTHDGRSADARRMVRRLTPDCPAFAGRQGQKSRCATGSQRRSAKPNQKALEKSPKITKAEPESWEQGQKNSSQKEQVCYSGRYGVSRRTVRRLTADRAPRGRAKPQQKLIQKFCKNYWRFPMYSVVFY